METVLTIVVIIITYLIYHYRAIIIGFIVTGNPCTSYPLYHKLLLVSERSTILRIQWKLDHYFKKNNKTEEERVKMHVLYHAINYHQKRFDLMVKANIDAQNGKSINDINKEYKKVFKLPTQPQFQIADEALKDLPKKSQGKFDKHKAIITYFEAIGYDYNQP